RPTENSLTQAPRQPPKHQSKQPTTQVTGRPANRTPTSDAREKPTARRANCPSRKFQRHELLRLVRLPPFRFLLVYPCSLLELAESSCCDVSARLENALAGSSVDPPCLLGFAPITRQSGQWQGKAFIGGGRKPLRDALYMPALVAMRHNPDLKAKYEDLRAAEKPAKVAIVAVMRKLIEMANALVKADRTWTPKTA
ncbi:MAG: transposase, partial [Roseovarius sp.]